MTEERIAKLIARSGACSRRDAEKIIAEGRVTHNGKIIETPALKFPNLEGIEIDGAKLTIKESKLWLYHKPVGLVVSHQDEYDRQTVFDNLPIKERVISVGRLDRNTSGLLLLTNDGAISRELELPSNNFKRVYMVRVYGHINFDKMKQELSKPLEIDGITYRPVGLDLEYSGPYNHWLKLTISEGKNREIRKIMEYFDLQVNKLIRIKYGPYELGDLKMDAVCEVSLP